MHAFTVNKQEKKMNYRMLAILICSAGAGFAMAADQLPHYKPGL
jgi:hypothetical protein